MAMMGFAEQEVQTEHLLPVHGVLSEEYMAGAAAVPSYRANKGLVALAQYESFGVQEERSHQQILIILDKYYLLHQILHG
jgi:hypothetical protein